VEKAGNRIGTRRRRAKHGSAAPRLVKFTFLQFSRLSFGFDVVMHNSHFRRLSLACGLLACLSAWPQAAVGQTAARIKEGLPDPLWPNNLLTPLDPKLGRSEEENDRIKAAALVAHGRVYQQQGKLDKALAKYQRAHRYAPQLNSILDDVVAIAFRLGRNETAARYAVIAAELEPKDAELTTQLGRYLAEKSELERAIGLYQQAVRLYRQDTENADAKGQVILLQRELGRLHYVLKEYDQAAEAFACVKQALEDPEKHGLNESQQKRALAKPELTYLLFGEAFLEAGRYDAAEAMFRKVNEAQQDEALLSYQLARIDARRGKHQQALDKLNKYFAAKLNAAGTAPYELLEQLLQETSGGQDVEKARRQTAERLIALRKDDAANTALAYRLAYLFRELGRPEEAAEIYEELAKSNPTIDAFQGLIHAYRRQGDIDRLLDALGKAVLQTGNLEPLGEEGEALVKDEETVKKLVAVAGQRRRDEPDSLSVGKALGAALAALSTERFDEANQLFSHAYDRADKEDKARIVSTWGIEMLVADQFDAAAAAFRRAIGDKIDPDREAGFHYYLSGALELDGKTSAAQATARKATELEKDSARFEARGAWILYHAKRYKEAEQEYLALLKKYDGKYDDPEVRDVIRDARLVLSNTCIQRDDLPQAEEWLEQVLDEFPEDIGALNDLGYLWVDQNKHLNRSLKMIEIAVEAEPDNIAYLDSLGWAYYRLGRFEEAVEELKKAAESEEDPDGVILDHLGDAYLAAGTKDKALGTWRRAAEAFQRDKEAKLLRTIRKKIKEHEAEK
jgi:tetratricopeptide (TPR) repeat protein